MQSKIAHAAERKAFSIALDQLINAAAAEDRAKKIDKLVSMGSKLLKDTAPGAARGLRAGLYPGSKWENFLFSLIDEVDHNIIKLSLIHI